jgi:hypothetical protein
VPFKIVPAVQGRNEKPEKLAFSWGDNSCLSCTHSSEPTSACDFGEAATAKAKSKNLKIPLKNMFPDNSCF